MMRRFFLLWLCAAFGLVSSADAYTYNLTVKNTGSLPFGFNISWAVMDSGWPEYPEIGGGTEVPANSEVKVSESWTGAARYAYALTAYYGGGVIGRSRGSATYTDYYKTISFAVETPPVPPNPTNSVPPNFPLGTTANNIGLVDYPNTSADGSWLWDDGLGAWIWDSNWTKSSFVPPTAPAGYRWEFGQRPGGHVMAPNDDTPEWFLMPDGQYVGNDGEILEPFDPSDFPDGDGVQGAGMERIDYWGRVNADGAVRREDLLRNLKISVDSTRSDIRAGFAGTDDKLDDLAAGVGAVESAVDQSAQTIKDAIEQGFTVDVDVPSEIEVDLGDGSYAGYGDLVDLGDWANADADLYQTGVDTNFGSAAISPSIGLSDYNILTGDGDSWISGLGNGVAGAVETLLAGVTAFLDPFKAIGKVESLTVTIYEKPMVIDFSPFMAVINVVRAIAVLAVYYLAFCSVRSAVFMIFGGA